jgi:hypothetical protein
MIFSRKMRSKTGRRQTERREITDWKRRKQADNTDRRDRKQKRRRY